jgi:hypothetical protein
VAVLHDAWSVLLVGTDRQLHGTIILHHALCHAKPQLVSAYADTDDLANLDYTRLADRTHSELWNKYFGRCFMYMGFINTLVAAGRLGFLQWLETSKHWPGITTFFTDCHVYTALRRNDVPMYTYLRRTVTTVWEHSVCEAAAHGRAWTILEEAERAYYVTRPNGGPQVYGSLVIAMVQDPVLVLPERWDALHRAAIPTCHGALMAMVRTRQYGRIQAYHAAGAIPHDCYRYLFRTAVQHQQAAMLAWLAVLGTETWQQGVIQAMYDLVLFPQVQWKRARWIWNWVYVQWQWEMAPGPLRPPVPFDVSRWAMRLGIHCADTFIAHTETILLLNR